jgi:aryl-alcohol dehydrogenase-like predicted oxidoreductase
MARHRAWEATVQYRTIGRSGLKVSTLGLGTGSPTFCGRMERDDALKVIREAVDLGVTFFDTAETYAEGRAEELLGAALAGRRDEVVLATKFGKDRSVPVSEQPGSRRRIMAAVEGSLRRLGTDRIDLYILHEPDPDTPIEETLGALDDLVRVGKVRYIACSEFAAWQLSEALWTSRVERLAGFIGVGAHYNLIDRGHDELRACVRAHGIGLVPTAPLAGGFLTGKYERGLTPAADTRFGTVPRWAGPKYQDIARYASHLSESRFASLDRIRQFADERGVSVTAVGLAWLRAHEEISVVPVGVTSAEQLRRNVLDSEWSMTADEFAALEALLSA